MAVKRLFIGTILPSSIIGNHSEKIQKEFSEVCTGKWVEDANAHLNYKFLGNVEEDRIPEIKEALEPYLKKHALPLYINNLDCFFNGDSPKVLYARLYSPEKAIHKTFINIERICTKELRFPKEKGRFQPHITLCRIKTATEDFNKKLEEFKEYKIGFLKYYKINLIASTLTNDGPTYEIL